MGLQPIFLGAAHPGCLLAAVAFAISSYMALYQWRLIPWAWDPVFGEQTQRVLDSGVSERLRRWFGIPDAALGAAAYLGDVIFGLAGSTRRWQYRPWLVVLFGIDVIPLGLVGAVLVIMQATVVGYWCFLCLVTAGISLLLIWLAYDEVWSSLTFLGRFWHRTHSLAGLWNTLLGKGFGRGRGGGAGALAVCGLGLWSACSASGSS